MPKSELPITRRIRSGAVYNFFCLFLLFTLGPCSGSVLAHAQLKNNLAVKNVLVLHSGEANAPVFLKTDKGISTKLESGGISNPNQFFESLNLEMNPEREYRKIMVEKLRLQYSHRKIDVIITMYPAALEFVLSDCRNIFPDIPIVALYLQKGIDLSYINRTIIEHTAKLDIDGTIETALSLVPGAKRVYVVSGIHEVDRQIEAQARRDLKKWESMLEFHYLSHMSFDDMLTTVSHVPPDSIILLLVLVRDVKGTRYTTPVVAQRLSNVAAAPIFGVVDTGLGYGIVGGSLLDTEHIGSAAGELALGLLGGNPPPKDASKILKTPPMSMFDWRELRRWNLSESALPEKSVIVNREFSLWDFRYYIVGALIFSLAETALIVLLILQRRRKKSAEESLRKAEEKYRSIFEGAPEGIFETLPQGQPMTVNPALAFILGYDSPEEYISKIGDVGRQLYPDPDKRDELVKLIETQDVVLGFECELLRRDGSKIWTSISSRRVCDPDGKTLYYSGFVRDISERKQAEEASRKSDIILQQSENELRMLAGRLIHSQEEERSRLARELHDDLVQRLAVFAIDIGRLEGDMVDQPISVQEKIREMKNDMIKISGDVHNLSRRLHPCILEDLGLIRAVESQCADFSRREGTEVTFSHESIPTDIPMDISLSLYRIVQECLSNISKHACAEHISVSLQCIDTELLLSVQDDGIGFSSAEVKGQSGLGLSSIRERVRLIDGKHSIDSWPGKGTHINVRVTLPHKEQNIMREGE